MRISIIEAKDGLTVNSIEWNHLADSIKAAKPDLLITNEMPFGPWLAEAETWNAAAAATSVEMHEAGLEALKALDVPTIVSSRPVPADGRIANEAFVLEAGVYRAIHHKHYFPAEPGWHEDAWFKPDRSGFDAVQAGGIKLGVLLCTELFFNEWARHYRHQGAQLIAIPRASGTSMRDWHTAGAMAAIVSGCYVVSSNRVGRVSDDLTFGGGGFVFSPDGERLACTSAGEPVITFDFDPDAVARRQKEYPCYVPEFATST